MGYCQDHDKVYTGAECPECTQNKTELKDPATRQQTGRTEDESEEDPVDEFIDQKVDDTLDDVSVENEGGDVVVGDQDKNISSRREVDIDKSETKIDQSKTEHDDRTVVNDSIVQDSNIGSDGPATVDDSVVKDSNVAGSDTGERAAKETNTEPSSQPPAKDSPNKTDSSKLSCPECGETVPQKKFCLNCGTQL